MLKTTLPYRRHAMFAGSAFLGARAALIGNGWWHEFRRLELGRCVLRRNQWQGGSVGSSAEGRGLINDDFAHGFAASVIEHGPQG